MKKLYDEFFHIPKEGKIREKVMLTRVAMTAVIMIVCLAAMSFTAYAYFSHSVISGSNIIHAANFEADVKIQITDATGTPVPVTTVDRKTRTAVLEKGNTYFVTLDESERSTAKTGFLVITAKDCDSTYHTQQLGADTAANGGKTDKITFQMMVSENTTVTFLSHWGTSSHYDPFGNAGSENFYITNDCIGAKAVKMTIGGTAFTAEDAEDTEDKKEEQSDKKEDSTDSKADETEVLYTVQLNDNLWDIAQEYGVTTTAIQAYNNLKNSIINPGDVLKIPPEDWKIPQEYLDKLAASASKSEEKTDSTKEASAAPSFGSESTESSAPSEGGTSSGTTDETPKPDSSTESTPSVTTPPTTDPAPDPEENTGEEPTA